MERKLEEHRREVERRTKVPGKPGASYALGIPMDDDLAEYVRRMSEWKFQNPKQYDPNDPNAPSPFQLLKGGKSTTSGMTAKEIIEKFSK